MYGAGNTCVPGDCRVDSDCGPGGYCSPTVAPNGLSLSGYYCHTPLDQCIDDTDCPTAGAPTPSLGFCYYAPTTARWQCQVLPQPI
jgi:hypothetical protein